MQRIVDNIEEAQEIISLTHKTTAIAPKQLQKEDLMSITTVMENVGLALQNTTKETDANIRRQVC